MILVALSSAGCAQPAPSTSPADDRIADDRELTRLFSNNTLYGSAWIEYYRPDGTSIFYSAKGTCPGTWKVESGMACFAYESFDKGMTNCFLIKRSGGLIVFVNPNDPRNGMVANKTVAGNPEHLTWTASSCRS